MSDSITINKKDIVLLAIGLAISIPASILMATFNQEIVDFVKPALMQLSHLMGSMPERLFYSLLADSYVSKDSKLFNTAVSSFSYEILGLLYFCIPLLLMITKKIKKLQSEVDSNNSSEDKKNIIKRSIFYRFHCIIQHDNFHSFLTVTSLLIFLFFITLSLNTLFVYSRLFEFSKSVVLLKPYISEQKTNILISDWVSMTSQKDYDQLQKKIEIECKNYKINCSR
jgi:hypothetical protein